MTAGRFRSEESVGGRADVFYYRADRKSHNERNDLFDTEITIHSYAGGTAVQNRFWLGVKARDDEHNRWVTINVDDVDDIITALLYAKKLAVDPTIRPNYKQSLAIENMK
jgi:hypothetical protein